MFRYSFPSGEPRKHFQVLLSALENFRLCFLGVCRAGRRESPAEALPPVPPNCNVLEILLSSPCGLSPKSIFPPPACLLRCHFVRSHSLQSFLQDILDTAIYCSSVQAVCSLLIPCLPLPDFGDFSVGIHCSFPLFPTSSEVLLCLSVDACLSLTPVPYC